MSDPALPTYRNLVRSMSRVGVLRGLAAFLRGMDWDAPNTYLATSTGEEEARKHLDEYERDNQAPSLKAYRAIATRDRYSDR